MAKLYQEQTEKAGEVEELAEGDLEKKQLTINYLPLTISPLTTTLKSS